MYNTGRSAWSNPMGLGDRVEAALQLVGITEDRVSRWIGAPCNCKERIEKLNLLGHWTNRVLSGRVQGAAQYLIQFMGTDNDNS